MQQEVRERIRAKKNPTTFVKVMGRVATLSLLYLSAFLLRLETAGGSPIVSEITPVALLQYNYSLGLVVH